jgi:hypothetical protein
MVFQYGMCGDLWGFRDWTPSEINNANFGLYFSAMDYSCLIFPEWDIMMGYVDHISITVYYDVP